MRDRDLALEYAVHNVVHWGLNFHRDAEGRTEAERWETEGWPGLNNDGRVLARHARNTRPAVIEVRRVLDEFRCECVDLFQPEAPPVVVMDRSLALAVVPFTVLLVWLAPYPHYHRALGVAMELGPDLWEPLRHLIEARYAEVRQEQPELDFMAFFAEHMRWVGERAAQLQKAKDQPKLPTIFHARFTLRTSAAEVAALLEAEPDFRREPDDDEETALEAGGSRTFLWEPSSDADKAEQADEEPPWQTVQLSAQTLSLSCLQPETRQALRERVEQMLGDRIAFVEETAVDLAETLAAREEQERLVEVAQQAVFRDPEEPAADATPPSDQELDEAAWQEKLREQYGQALEEPLSWLEGKTLREAARDEKLRPQVAQTVKVWLHGVGQMNQAQGWSLNLDWILDDLDLDELK
jgi:hypothetical protein